MADALDLLLVEDPAIYERERRPMVGRPFSFSWDELATWLSRPSLATHKAEQGAWTPALFTGNRKVKANLIHASALTFDVDEGGDVDRIANVLEGTRAIFHSTFSSTPTAPRCRIVVPLVAPVDAPTYERVWRIGALALARKGIEVDAGTKDAGRLNFLPCVRAGAVYSFRRVEGAELDARAVIAAQRPEPPRSAPRPIADAHLPAYVNAAARRAAHNVACASEGERHYMLSREAFSLARFGLGESEISRSLLPSFVAAAGERRQREGERTIRDAVRAMRAKGAA